LDFSLGFMEKAMFALLGSALIKIRIQSCVF